MDNIPGFVLCVNTRGEDTEVDGDYTMNQEGADLRAEVDEGPADEEQDEDDKEAINNNSETVDEYFDKFKYTIHEEYDDSDDISQNDLYEEIENHHNEPDSCNKIELQIYLTTYGRRTKYMI